MAWEARLGLKQSRLNRVIGQHNVKMAWEARLGLKLQVSSFFPFDARRVKMAWEARLGLKLIDLSIAI